MLREKLYHVSYRFTQLATLLLTTALFLSSFLFTCYAENMETQQALLRRDFLPGNIIGLVLVCLFLGGFVFLLRRTDIARLKRALLCLTLGWILLAGTLLILFSKTVPAADSLSVYRAAQMLAANDTSVIHPTDSYLSYYPQQVGLMAFWELLFRLWNRLSGLLSLFTAASLPAYHFFKGVYVLLLCLAVFFQYRSVQLFWENDITDCIYLLFAGMNVPMLLYSSFLYGEIPSFTAFCAGLYCLLQACRRGRGILCLTTRSGIGYALGSIVLFSLSVMLRKNSLILMIAVFCVILLEGLRRSKKGVLSGVLLYLLLGAVCVTTILPLVQKGYELRANSTLQSGVTPLSYIAMGMQEASRGCGWYNDFNLQTYQDAGMDTAAANEISRLAIAERLDYFRENPSYAAEFYLQKYLSQWTDGTYASRQATLATFGGRKEIFHSLYEGRGSRWLIEYSNLYQNLLYFGAFLFCIYQVRQSKKTRMTLPPPSKRLRACCPPFRRSTSPKKASAGDLAGSLLPFIGLIGVLGGFLFHMLWEANSRYIFLYGMLLMPYAAQGLTQALSPASLPEETSPAAKKD